MPKREIRSAAAPAPKGPYSQGIAAGGFLFVAGQGPVDVATGEFVGETIEEQTERTLENIKAVVEAAGMTLADVVKATVHLADMNDFQRFNAVYARYFPEPRPARTTVGSGLPAPMKVEIDVVVYLGH